jgi:hypothetical protein
MYRMTTVSSCNLKASRFAAGRPSAAVHGILPKLKDRGDSGTRIAQGSFGVRARTLASCTDPCNPARPSAATKGGARGYNRAPWEFARDAKKWNVSSTNTYW